MMGSTALYLNTPYSLSSSFLSSNNFKHYITTKYTIRTISTKNLTSFNNNNRRQIRAIGIVPEKDQANETSDQSEEELEQPYVGFAFVSSVLLPDGTPDLHLRSATGGQKLRDIMLDNDIDLYGPYARPLLNCAGGGTCGSCMVEVIEGKELLNPRTEKEKEHLKKKPKNWRLACQTTVGTPDSRGMVVIQQLPEWKAHEWNYEKDFPSVS
ncbi:photosynthetic NDH subunit of subcomplex B 3, chloroplastic-like [Chenopodium quinoa]|uniref:2Fe-2S ferredoxin-type domain-containing protein n=1 Tax=Chenopodium quinoa TaxID=63459 RepID=A0A803MLR0_CHEQI|nr:photosynthetic NDH subunit of subcomplex B 3, chloroplastic-like [Chenopodium quinoa]